MVMKRYDLEGDKQELCPEKADLEAVKPSFRMIQIMSTSWAG